MYRIEYVLYRQGPYRIRIDTADYRVVPALDFTVHSNKSLLPRAGASEAGVRSRRAHHEGRPAVLHHRPADHLHTHHHVTATFRTQQPR